MKGSEPTVAMDEFRKRSFPLLTIFSLIIPAISAANDTIDTSQSISDGETLVSPGGLFEFGFFNPGNSTNRYLGIWYKNITVRTYVWVANREFPLTTNSGVVQFTEPGILALFNSSNGSIIWSSNATTPVGNPTAQLLDTGNLVVKDANDDRPDNVVWQSFDHPSDTLLAGMSLGWNLVTGSEYYLTSWKSDDDPGRGEFSLHLDPAGLPQILLKKGEAIESRLGPWNGLRFSGIALTNSDPTYSKALRRSVNEIVYRESGADPSLPARSMLNPDGVGQRWTWAYQTNSWTIYGYLPADQCDRYGLCGSHGVCNIANSPPCVCLDRFVPDDPLGWSVTWSNGCIRRTPLNCQGDIFLRYSGIKLPDARNSSVNDQIRSLAECEAECSRECNCTAYTRLNISGSGSGCLFYHGDHLVDIRTMPEGGQDLYIRMASTESAESEGKKRVILIASLASVAAVVVVCVSLILVCRRRRKKRRNNERKEAPFVGNVGKEAELPFFSLSTIVKATDNFSNNNKLGEGGFGPVYKGMLEDGQEIAVKRLSETSKQGVDELKNEVILIAKLQHRNLVKTLGCCADGEENMLIYEFMPNSSLDLILFDQTKSMLLDWKKRFNIINGIAKGLLYLHQDSRLRIIHRDLKASNILLDANMNPKISDFGLARGFGENEIEAKTHRVVGTYGYMSPEYAIDGLFSVKSDVFSFGVLVLEIVSGKRNRGFHLEDHNLNLLGHAWTLYKEERLVELVDASLEDSFDLSQALRSIHVGLLCVQRYSEDRPSMSSVVFMLGNEVQLPQIKQPGFFTERDVSSDQSSSTHPTDSVNHVTITLPVGR